MKIVMPKKKNEPTWPFPTQPPVPDRVHVPPKPNPDNYEDSLL